MSTQAPQTPSDLGRFYGLFPQPDLARDLFNIVEGHRIDARLRLAYPGIRRDMHTIATATIERREGLSPGASEAQAVMEGLLTHTLGAAADLSSLPDAIAQLVTDAIALMDRVADPTDERCRQRPHRSSPVCAHRRRPAARPAKPVREHSRAGNCPRSGR